MCAWVLVFASVADAAPNVAQNTQKGSVLMFPDVDVRGTVATIVRMQNDANVAVWVRCHYVDADRRRNDFAFLMTRGQPIWFDVKTGAGTIGANPFPSGAGAGMLVCFAVDAEERNQVRWNHLSGTATIIDYALGTAYEYNAWAFYAYGDLRRDGDAVPAPADFVMPPPCDSSTIDCFPSLASGDQVIALDGTHFDQCPTTLVGQFSPEGTVLGDEGGADFAEFGRTRAVFVGCALDVRQRSQRYDTKLTFEVWNEDELKLTGAHDCADGWHETGLSNVKEQGDNFLFRDLRTGGARYRVTSVKDDVSCGRSTARVGLIGVQSTLITLGGRFARAGGPLTAAGRSNGFLVWNAADVIAEGTAR